MASLRDNKRIQRAFDKCIFCGGVAGLKLCARCKAVAYCSKEHQRQDWLRGHKNICKILELPSAKTSEISDSVKKRGSMGVVTNQMSTLLIKSNNISGTVTSNEECVLSQSEQTPQGYELFTKTTDSSVESSRAEGTLTEFDNNNRLKRKETNISTDIVPSEFGVDVLLTKVKINNSMPTETIQDLVETGSSEKFILESAAETNMLLNEQVKKMPYFSVVEARSKALSDYVIECLNAYGLCVIDNFLGDSKGTDILDEVSDMHLHGELTSGQLVNTNSSNEGAVRGDLITWVDGSELGCANINFLVTSIDAIMLHCQQSLGHYCIKGRSKAMVATYPGKSTHFLRHVDNPSGDGRCVTCIYYLNKNWNSKNDGGLLRVFPEGSNRVANVEPKFDRLLFFWSDRRNPHEVLPAYRTRYAITVWYYDEFERRQAIKKFRGSSNMEVKLKHDVVVFPFSNNVVNSNT